MQMNSQVMVNGGEAGGEFGGKRGTKRDASDSNLSDFERFEKRLRMLSLRTNDPINNRKIHPIDHASRRPLANATPSANHVPAAQQHEHMQLDDTRDRVYVHDIDAELAEIEEGEREEKLIFLPDIEKKLSTLPKHILTSGKEADHENQELVLYSVPHSLTVDESHDSVRKAIVETRQRARERAMEEARQNDMNRKYEQLDDIGLAETAHGYGAGYTVEPTADEDLDMMDIG